MEMNSIILKCACSTHMLEFERYSDEYKTETGSFVDKGFYVTTWVIQSPTKQLSWRDKLRWIKQILIHGSLWSDGVVLTDDDVIKLKNYITKHTEEKEVVTEKLYCQCKS